MTGTAVATNRTDDLRTLLLSARNAMMQVLPPSSDLTAEKIVRLAMMDVSQNSALMACTPNSILTSVVHAAALGLQIGPFLGEAYLVPFKGKCQLIPGYRGLAKLAMQGLSITSLSTRLVYEGDYFKVFYGTNPRIEHEPDFKGKRGDDAIIAGYMVADLRGGGQHFTVMTRDEVLKRRNNSKAKDDGPWVAWFPEQFEKTVTKKGVKLLPASSDANALERLHGAVELDNRYDTQQITAPNPLLDTQDSLRRDLTERTQQQASSLREKISGAKAAAEELTEEQHLELDRKLAAEEGGDVS